MNDYVHIEAADLRRPNARFTTERQGYQVLTPFGKLGYSLKILPDAFAADPDRLARFKREAQILASLNHPNIAAIYGIEEAEGTRCGLAWLRCSPPGYARVGCGAELGLRSA